MGFERIDKERRRFRRVKIAFDVEYSVEGAGLSEKKSLAKNIGAGGLCVIAYKKLEIDSVLSLEVHLPDGGDPLRMKGRLIWIRQFSGQDKLVRYDAGIEFLNTEQQDLQRLSRYISQLPD